MSSPEMGRGDDPARSSRVHSSAIPGDQDPDVRGREGEDRAKDPKAREIQPGTAEPGRSWQSRSPLPHDEDDKLNQALKDSFPASDPPQPAQPGITGWDLKDKPARGSEKRPPTSR